MENTSINVEQEASSVKCIPTTSSEVTESGRISVVPFANLAEDSNSCESMASTSNIAQSVTQFQIEIDTNQQSKYITPTKSTAKKRGKTDNMGREWPSTGKKSKFSFPQDVIDPHIPLSQQSVRRIRRENTILEAVRTGKVIVDPSTLHKLILDQERKEGCHDGSMDRKSLHRILSLFYYQDVLT